MAKHFTPQQLAEILKQARRPVGQYGPGSTFCGSDGGLGVTAPAESLVLCRINYMSGDPNNNNSRDSQGYYQAYLIQGGGLLDSTASGGKAQSEVRVNSDNQLYDDQSVVLCQPFSVTHGAATTSDNGFWLLKPYLAAQLVDSFWARLITYDSMTMTYAWEGLNPTVDGSNICAWTGNGQESHPDSTGEHSTQACEVNGYNSAQLEGQIVRLYIYLGNDRTFYRFFYPRPDVDVDCFARTTELISAGGGSGDIELLNCDDMSACVSTSGVNPWSVDIPSGTLCIVGHLRTCGMTDDFTGVCGTWVIKTTDCFFPS